MPTPALYTLITLAYMVGCVIVCDLSERYIPGKEGRSERVLPEVRQERPAHPANV